MTDSETFCKLNNFVFPNKDNTYLNKHDVIQKNMAPISSSRSAATIKVSPNKTNSSKSPTSPERNESISSSSFVNPRDSFSTSNSTESTNSSSPPRIIPDSPIYLTKKNSPKHNFKRQHSRNSSISIPSPEISPIENSLKHLDSLSLKHTSHHDTNHINFNNNDEHKYYSGHEIVLPVSQRSSLMQTNRGLKSLSISPTSLSIDSPDSYNTKCNKLTDIACSDDKIDELLQQKDNLTLKPKVTSEYKCIDNKSRKIAQKTEEKDEEDEEEEGSSPQYNSVVALESFNIENTKMKKTLSNDSGYSDGSRRPSVVYIVSSPTNLKMNLDVINNSLPC